MRKSIFLGIVLVAVLTAHAGQTTAAHNERAEYVVWVDALHLRAGPSKRANVVTVLRRGDVLKDPSGSVEYADGFWWRYVRVGGTEGWVADEYTLPAAVFSAFEEADKLGKTGDAEGMLAAIVEGNRVMGVYVPDETDYYSISPDGNKVIVQVDMRLFNSGYPQRSRMSDDNPILFFESGKGLVRSTVYEVYETGDWYQGNRYYVYVGLKPEEDWLRLAPLRIFDTETAEEKQLGACGTGRETRNFEFADGFIVWSSVEDIPPGEVVLPEYGEMMCKPVLMAYESATGKRTRVLEADMDTMEKEHSGSYPCAGIYFFKVRMEPVGPVPEAVERSKLYKKYNGGTDYVWSETGA